MAVLNGSSIRIPFFSMYGELEVSTVGMPIPGHAMFSQAALPIVVSCLTCLMLISEQWFPNFLYRFIVGSSGEKPTHEGTQHLAEAERQELQRRRRVSDKEVGRLRIGAWAAFVLMIIDVTGGILTNSMALVAESLHLFSDASSFVMSIWAIELMNKKATPQFSYGLQQAGALGTLSSMITIWVMAGVLSMEAVHRLYRPEPVDGALMTVVASFGLLSNVLLMATLGHHHANLETLLSSTGETSRTCCCSSPSKEPQDQQTNVTVVRKQSLKFCDAFAAAASGSCEQSHGMSNKQEGASLAMRAAVIHIIGDIVQSIGAVLAGLVIWWQPFDVGTTSAGFSRWCYVDASITLLYAFLCLLTTRSTVKEAIMNLLMMCPQHIDIKDFQTQLRRLDGVVTTHEMHVWKAGQSNVATAHVVIKDSACVTAILNSCTNLAQKIYKMDHTTFQFEVEREANLRCRTEEIF